MEETAPFLCPPSEKVSPKWEEIEENLQQNDNREKKIQALKDLIRYQASGEYPPEKIIITIINYVMPSKDHEIKKLMFLYFEIVETRDRKGELKPIFLLICDAIGKDLLHPNEYIRSAALRFISRFNEPNLISSLASFVSQSLSHPQDYVRRHAVVAIGRIHQRWPHLAPDAPSDIAELLRTEQHPACKRVAFLVLCDISRDYAAEFLDEVVEGSLLKLSQPMQITATSLIKALCSDKRKAAYLPPLLELLESPSPAVKMEAALTLLNLTESATASQAAFSTLCGLLQTIPNSSLQLSIADQIEKLIPTHMSVASFIVGELLVALKAKVVREKILGLIPRLTSSTNVMDVVSSLIHHLQGATSLRNNENEKQDALEFTKLLLQSLRTISSSFPQILKVVYDGVKVLVTDTDFNVSYESMMIIRETANSNEQYREIVIGHIENLLDQIKSSRVMRSAIFLISIMTSKKESVDLICDMFSSSETQEVMQDATTVVLADGTYVTRMNDDNISFQSPSKLIQNDQFLAASIAVSVARICCRLENCNIPKALAFIEYLVSLPNSKLEDRRFGFAYSAIKNRNDPNIQSIIVKASEGYYIEYINQQQQKLVVKPVQAGLSASVAVDERLSFSSILGKKFEGSSKPIKKIKKVSGELHQMTGTSDPIFCECRTISNKFDISLSFRLLNQTVLNLTNVHIELNCVGRLELIDRPAPLSLAPGSSESVTFSVKVTSAEAGRVFGSIVYDIGPSFERRFLPLSVFTVPSSEYMECIKMDLISFRNKWDEFEWEKKIPINCTASSLKEYVERLCKVMKFYNIGEIDEELPFVTTNLYSKSFFGEEIVININIEINEGNISGFIRLRADSQNMAVAFSRMIQSFE